MFNQILNKHPIHGKDQRQRCSGKKTKTIKQLNRAASKLSRILHKLTRYLEFYWQNTTNNIPARYLECTQFGLLANFTIETHFHQSCPNRSPRH